MRTRRPLSGPRKPEGGAAVPSIAACDWLGRCDHRRRFQAGKPHWRTRPAGYSRACDRECRRSALRLSAVGGNRPRRRLVRPDCSFPRCSDGSRLIAAVRPIERWGFKQRTNAEYSGDARNRPPTHSHRFGRRAVDTSQGAHLFCQLSTSFVCVGRQLCQLRFLRQAAVRWSVASIGPSRSAEQ